MVDAFWVVNMTAPGNDLDPLFLLELAQANRAIKRPFNTALIGKHGQRSDDGGVRAVRGPQRRAGPTYGLPTAAAGELGTSNSSLVLMVEAAYADGEEAHEEESR